MVTVSDDGSSVGIVRLAWTTQPPQDGVQQLKEMIEWE
nr:MAG TPA: hypothetical protein [Caudoviricetes sp.]